MNKYKLKMVSGEYIIVSERMSALALTNELEDIVRNGSNWYVTRELIGGCKQLEVSFFIPHIVSIHPFPTESK